METPREGDGNIESAYAVSSDGAVWPALTDQSAGARDGMQLPR